MTPRTAFIYCTLALLFFTAISFVAVCTKSATIDEPPHITAAYAHLRHGDFRLQPDHPPLWKYLAALPWLLGPPVNDHYDDPHVRTALSSIQTQWTWSLITLYRTPGNDADSLLSRSRFMMLLFAIALGITLSLFSYHLAGPLAACIAATLYALDPNFIAHASLIKNDVAITFTFTALIFTLYLIGQRLTPWRIFSLCLFTAACVTTKLTGLLAAPLILILLLYRSFLPIPWPLTRNRELPTRSRRLLLSLTLCLLCFVTTYFSIWALYLFRFNPSPDPSLHINLAEMLASSNPANSALPPSPVIRFCRFFLDHHLLPEAFLDGLIFTSTHVDRVTYFLGQVTPTGRWLYFPVAFLVKTPLTTLLCFLLSLITLLSRRLKPIFPNTWLPACLGVPAFIFCSTAILSQLNIGIRHLFPLYPLLFIAVAVILSRLYAHRPPLFRIILPLLLLSLGFESLSVYPDFIPFFNLAAGGSQGGYHLLSDSNLDWGQDLLLVADWQQQHPDRPLYLAYFGSADPAYYGIHYHSLPYGFALGPPPEPLPSSNATIAVSAMILQHVWYNNQPDYYAPLRHRHPTQILGGSIYLFDLGRN